MLLKALSYAEERCLPLIYLRFGTPNILTAMVAALCMQQPCARNTMQMPLHATNIATSCCCYVEDGGTETEGERKCCKKPYQHRSRGEESPESVWHYFAGNFAADTDFSSKAPQGIMHLVVACTCCRVNNLARMGHTDIACHGVV